MVRIYDYTSMDVKERKKLAKRLLQKNPLPRCKQFRDKILQDIESFLRLAPCNEYTILIHAKRFKSISGYSNHRLAIFHEFRDAKLRGKE